MRESADSLAGIFVLFNTLCIFTFCCVNWNQWTVLAFKDNEWLNYFIWCTEGVHVMSERTVSSVGFEDNQVLLTLSDDTQVNISSLDTHHNQMYGQRTMNLLKTAGLELHKNIHVHMPFFWDIFHKVNKLSPLLCYPCGASLCETLSYHCVVWQLKADRVVMGLVVVLACSCGLSRCQ